MVNVLPLAVGESVTTMIDLERIHEDVNLFMVTEFGVVKRTAIEEYTATSVVLGSMLSILTKGIA